MVVGPDEVTVTPRMVGGEADPGRRPSTGLQGSRIAWLVAVAAIVIVALLVLALQGGGSAATAPGAATPPPLGAGSAGVSTTTGTSDGASGASALTDPSGATGPTSPTGPTTAATVTRVVDGDTVIVDIGGRSFRLRYIGMDTPESVKPDTPVEPFAKDAAAANRRLVDGQPVILEQDVSETDQYDRLLRDVWVKRNGALVLVGFELVREGLANVTTYPPDVKYVDELLAAQAQARAQSLGIWSTP